MYVVEVFSYHSTEILQQSCAFLPKSITIHHSRALKQVTPLSLARCKFARQPCYHYSLKEIKRHGGVRVVSNITVLLLSFVKIVCVARNPKRDTKWHSTMISIGLHFWGREVRQQDTDVRTLCEATCFRLNDATRSITGEDTEKLTYLGLNLLLNGWKNATSQAKSRRPFTAEANPCANCGKQSGNGQFFCVYFDFPLSGSFYQFYEHILHAFTTEAIHFL